MELTVDADGGVMFKTWTLFWNHEPSSEPVSWACEWNGLQIEVVCWAKGMRRGEQLFVNGVQVDSNEYSWWSGRMITYLAAPVQVSDSIHELEVIVGYLTTLRSHIFLDGELVGGDADLAIRVKRPGEDKRFREPVLAHYLVLAIGMIGIIPAIFVNIYLFMPVLPIEPILTFRLDVKSGLGVVVAISTGAPFGYLSWRYAKSHYESIVAKLEGEPRVVVKIAA